MRHRVKKIRFKQGKGVNKMLIRKLMVNFISRGKLTTTLAKTKILKSQIEKMVEKTKQETKANKNYLLRHFGNKKLFKFLFNTIGSTFKDVTGGYVRILKMSDRISDGSPIGKVEWTKPIIYETK